MASDGCEELMKAWFPKTTTAERKSLTETDMRDIAQVLLRTSDVSWSRIPRIYSVLRIIDQLPAIDSFLAEGITDVWFPFSQRSLPASFRTQSARLNFLDAQHLVCNTKALNLEREHAKHAHFPDAAEIPLKKIGDLGKGGYGFVDRVVSTISHREYARKLIPRGRTFKKDKQVLRAFERELSNLKSLSQQHTHIIELVGSYTDPKYVGILMLPVADCNLHELLVRPLEDGEKSLLRTFFGCLTSALCFLHDSRIRHKDIKPQNVLVKNAHVFLTDFGVSLDWSELSNSTTIGPTWSTPRYGAPEVAEHAARNSSADIWSLGCVFLEIWTVLKQQTTQALLHYMESTGALSSCYCSNIASIDSWIETVKALPGPQADNVPATWIAHMLQSDREVRWTAHTLAENIREYNSDPAAPFAFAGLCCLDDDDTAESVHSSINEDINDLTLRPSNSSVSLGYAPFPETSVVATEAHSKKVQDWFRQNQPPQPCLGDEETLAARETDNAFGSAARSHIVPLEENGDIENPASNPYPKIPQKQNSDTYSDHTSNSDSECDPESGLPDTRALSRNKRILKQALSLPNEHDDMRGKGEKKRVGGRPATPRQTSRAEQSAEIDSDGSMTAQVGGSMTPNVGHEAFLRYVPRPQSTPSAKYYYPTPSEGVSRTPNDDRVTNGHRTILHEPTRHRTRSPSPLRYRTPGPLRESPRVECTVCMNNDLPVNKTARLDCGHRMCHACLMRQFRLSVEDQHTPPKCCTHIPIPFVHVEQFFDDKFKMLYMKTYPECMPGDLPGATRTFHFSTGGGDQGFSFSNPEEVFVEYLRRWRDTGTDNDNFILADLSHCPMRGCEGLVMWSNVRMDLKTGRKYARCSHCNIKVCLSCKRKFHRRSACSKEEESLPVRNVQKMSRLNCYNCGYAEEFKRDCYRLSCGHSAQNCPNCEASWITCDCSLSDYRDLDDDCAGNLSDGRRSRPREEDERDGKDAKPILSRPDPAPYSVKIGPEHIQWSARGGGAEPDAKPKLSRRSRRRQATQGEEEHAETGKHSPDSVTYGRKIGPEDIRWSGTPEPDTRPKLGRHATYVY